MVAETEIAWAAGFFDGEGTTTYERGTAIRLSLPQCGSEAEPPHSLVRFHKAIGQRGSIYKAREGTDKWQPAWKWYCTAGARDVVALLWPYLSEAKLQQASAALLKAGAFVPKDRRKTICKNGHLLSETRRTDSRGKMYCVGCKKINNDRYNSIRSMERALIRQESGSSARGCKQV